MKQKRMSEAEVQNFEQGTVEQLTAYFAGLAPGQVAELFMRLLLSYRHASSVANAAWIVLDESKRDGHPSDASYKRLVDALHNYAPQSVPPSVGVHEAVMHALAGTHDTITKFMSVPEVQSWLREKITMMAKARWTQEGGS